MKYQYQAHRWQSSSCYVELRLYPDGRISGHHMANDGKTYENLPNVGQRGKKVNNADELHLLAAKAIGRDDDDGVRQLIKELREKIAEWT